MAMDYSEKWGTDVDAAVKLALDDLKLTIDEVDVTVLEQPSRGFFGIGSKLALVRVEKKKAPEVEVKEPEHKEEHVSKKTDKAQTQKTVAPKKEVKKEEIKNTKETKIIEEIEENLVPCEDHEALRFLREVTKEMGLNLDIDAKQGEETLYLNIQGKDSGTIIGKRGQTLDAIQYLTSLVVNKGSEDYVRVVVDAENYRAKREKTLEALAYRLANKVMKTKRSVKLEPMNPYERKVIHAALHDHPKVMTRSEGQDPYRRVVIELK
jgi:spoIIIJ-associated protein